jgi:hypothetical protein
MVAFIRISKQINPTGFLELIQFLPSAVSPPARPAEVSLHHSPRRSSSVAISNQPHAEG